MRFTREFLGRVGFEAEHSFCKGNPIYHMLREYPHTNFKTKLYVNLFKENWIYVFVVGIIKKRNKLNRKKKIKRNSAWSIHNDSADVEKSKLTTTKKSWTPHHIGRFGHFRLTWMIALLVVRDPTLSATRSILLGVLSMRWRRWFLARRMPMMRLNGWHIVHVTVAFGIDDNTAVAAVIAAIAGANTITATTTTTTSGTTRRRLFL